MAEDWRPRKRRREHSTCEEPIEYQTDLPIVDTCDQTADTFRRIASLIHATIADDLERLTANPSDLDDHDSMLECGHGPLAVLLRRPEKVLQLARDKTYEWTYKNVPQCWLRLCEDSSLLTVSKLLVTFAHEMDEAATTRQRRHEQSQYSQLGQKRSAMIGEVVEALDRGTALSGQPKRKVLVKSCFGLLDQCLLTESLHHLPSSFPIRCPARLGSGSQVPRCEHLPLSKFQQHLDGNNTPLVLAGVVDEWPAFQQWQSPAYLLRATSGGRRLALVEIGTSYAHHAMQQRLMSVKDFFETYIFDPHATEIGYIAQHDLLGHVASLSNDVLTPEYCYTAPPREHSRSVLSENPPRRNVWIGPQGTRSPFHTDPDANLYCQVVGYKYFRLVSADQSDKMYPRGTNEQALDLSNQSQVIDFSFARRETETWATSNFPLFASASYQEIILGPGDCLYIPTRCWHFAESLSTSIGVNFWWD